MINLAVPQKRYTLADIAPIWLPYHEMRWFPTLEIKKGGTANEPFALLYGDGFFGF
jgi:hypothetical protein